jgi:hypothetical protein
MDFALVLLAILILVSMGFMIRALQAMKRVHATAIWLQMQQQLSEPKMVQAVHTVQSLAQVPNMNGHGQPVLMNGQLDAVQTVNRYFANVGSLVRDRVLNEDQVLTLMSPMRDAWYASREYRDMLREKRTANHEDFDWLYIEWINGEYRQRARRDAA